MRRRIQYGIPIICRDSAFRKLLTTAQATVTTAGRTEPPQTLVKHVFLSWCNRSSHPAHCSFPDLRLIVRTVKA